MESETGSTPNVPASHEPRRQVRLGRPPPGHPAFQLIRDMATVFARDMRPTPLEITRLLYESPRLDALHPNPETPVDPDDREDRWQQDAERLSRQPAGSLSYIIRYYPSVWAEIQSEIKGGSNPEKEDAPDQTNSDRDASENTAPGSRTRTPEQIADDDRAITALFACEPEITRDKVAETLGLSNGTVSNSQAWKKLQSARKANRKLVRQANRTKATGTDMDTLEEA